MSEGPQVEEKRQMVEETETREVTTPNEGGDATDGEGADTSDE